MEYRIALPPRTPVDGERLVATLHGFDPAAIVDHDARIDRLRINIALSARALAEVLAALGITVVAIEAEPSVCCGGCGG